LEVICSFARLKSSRVKVGAWPLGADRMPEKLVVSPGVVVPADALSMRAVRSGGPGGQNVNKVASRVELRVDLDRIAGLDDAARARLRKLCAASLDSEGLLVVTSQRTRAQHMNLADARDKVVALVSRALKAPRRRRPTRPSAGSVERRLADKKRRSRAKATRRGSGRRDET
jgi:ribosome-associated protein